tara:strand:+ start:174 stop:434 length:261 start_codon:yes stop_codon:yes gene_type:complete
VGLDYDLNNLLIITPIKPIKYKVTIRPNIRHKYPLLKPINESTKLHIGRITYSIYRGTKYTPKNKEKARTPINSKNCLKSLKYPIK